MTLLTKAYPTGRQLALAETWPASVIELDLHAPNAARMHDYFMGNAHNWAADRELAGQIMKLVPAHAAAQANRRFVAKVVRHLAKLGVDQYLDLGTGIPGPDHIHGIVRQILPKAKVVYVDNDPIVAAFWSLTLSREPGIAFIRADFRRAADVLMHPRTRWLLDFTQPVAVILSGSLDYVRDDATALIAAYREALCPASYLAVSQVTADHAPAAMAAVVKLYQSTQTPLMPRSRMAVAELFAGFDILPPGVTDPAAWRPEKPDFLAPSLLYWAGLGRSR